MKALRMHRNGGPEVLVWEDCEIAPPGPGEVQVRHTAVALNFSDINVRRGGFYIARPLQFPVILGNEAAGVVEAVGDGVSAYRPGDRVGYVGSGGPFYENTGSYAERRNLPVGCLVSLPDTITDQQAAAVMLKGLTASMVINRYYKPNPGDFILNHGAASGVGLILTQWCRHLGATVIGTVGSAEKAEIVRAHGCAHPILYREGDFVAEVRRIVPEGVHSVFDGVGKDTCIKSFDCMRPFSMLVNYGNSSGHPEPVDLLLLAKKGSLAIARPAFSFHIAQEADRQRAYEELFGLVHSGVIRLDVGRTYPLRDAAAAHRDLEARATFGSVVLTL
ncbi:MAG: hypothetical protein RLZ98_1226 [Pseudomonadota bacterium]|jgi:NADPH2:quinone reductase